MSAAKCHCEQMDKWMVRLLKLALLFVLNTPSVCARLETEVAAVAKLRACLQLSEGAHGSPEGEKAMDLRARTEVQDAGWRIAWE